METTLSDLPVANRPEPNDRAKAHTKAHAAYTAASHAASTSTFDLDDDFAKQPSTFTPEEREQLILDYLPLAKVIAMRMSGRLPAHIELDDLIHSGIVGLIDAVNKFDASRKIKFKTYAEFRIKGAILDELRMLDWVPRSIRQKATKLERAYIDLEQKLGRSVSDTEMMEYLGITLEEFNEMIIEVRGIALISLDELQYDADEGNSHNLLEYVANLEEPSAAQLMNLDQVYKIVADAIDTLPEKERLVTSLYYYEGLTMKEIGQVLDITESRVSQIHTKAIIKLRAKLTKELE